MAPTHADHNHDSERRLHGRRADEALLPVLQPADVSVIALFAPRLRMGIQ
jgi:hypothetical protein